VAAEGWRVAAPQPRLVLRLLWAVVIRARN